MAKPFTRQDLEALAEAKALEKGLPAWLVKSVITQESNWNANAGNGTDGGSTGLMQIHPTNFNRFKTNAQQMRDPVQNIDVGTTILKEALTKAKGDIPLALVDYNAGGGRYSAFTKGQAISKTGQMLQPTTEAYIPEVLLRGAKFGGPAVTADDYAKLRQRFGSAQTKDDTIFKNAGVFVQGLKNAPSKLAAAPQVEADPELAQDSQVQLAQSANAAQLAQLMQAPATPPMADAGIGSLFDTPQAASVPLPAVQQPAADPMQATYADEQRKAVAAAFGEGDTSAEPDYPKWLKDMVNDHVTYG